MIRIFLLFFAMSLFNCFADEKNEVDEKIVKQLDSCIREVYDAQKNQKKFRESKGPFNQLFHLVDSMRYDSLSKILIGLMEEVKYSITGVVDGTKIRKGELSENQLKKIENQLQVNHYSKKFLKNKNHFKKNCMLKKVRGNEKVEVCQHRSDLTVQGLHKALKGMPAAFCSGQKKWISALNYEYEIETISDLSRHSDLVRFSQSAIDKANEDLETIEFFKSLTR